jgi:hypothetical protein
LPAEPAYSPYIERQTDTFFRQAISYSQ